MISKRRMLFALQLKLWHSYNRIARRKKKKILFDCPYDFHYSHLQPLIESLSRHSEFDITVVKTDDFSQTKLEGVKYIDTDTLQQEIFAVYDIYFTTEFDILPWWFTGVTRIFFLHGVGPKVSYFASEKLRVFDVVLAPGPYVESKQRAFLKKDAVLYPAGLPVTDRYFLPGEQSLPAYIKFEEKKNIILYAPSWSSNPGQVSIDLDILHALSSQTTCNVIIRPHPNLLVPELCAGIKWKEVIEEILSKNRRIFLHAGRGTSVYEVLGCVDILLGDISSVVYEFLALDRPIILYLKEGVDEFYQSEEFVLETRLACYNINDPATLPATVLRCLQNKNSLSAERKKMMARSLYNPGRAIPQIIKILTEL
ncbi:CDP-glycerol glycerophosphotransferase (TagB/SpsB family) [Nitrosospira multiformis]|uniref:CDP-glycerol glycerophosphotransferase (TagB/SpsB family) n=1 Tax=Nitrosospira multiformis TaxID=1231 RepID=A0A2T5I5Q6_9PROT|nr:CDP-glycerol glycerophosphotransferase family protein [Nitrosospira multiformis]PTQ79165.1 CDP-glycerol glycerophosphotransferase (TagB/SpsB family) [Nitrosospira multiformis]